MDPLSEGFYLGEEIFDKTKIPLRKGTGFIELWKVLVFSEHLGTKMRNSSPAIERNKVTIHIGRSPRLPSAGNVNGGKAKAIYWHKRGILEKTNY